MAELISRTLFFTVPFYENQIKVTVTKKAADVDKWIGQTIHIHRRRLHKLLIGLDIEWLACINPTDKNNPKIALLQLCVGRRCLLFQLLHADCIPNSLRAFLANPNFTFVGVGIQGDVYKLFEDHGLFVANSVDLYQLALVVRKFEPEYGIMGLKRMGLKRMAYEVLGKVMEKPLKITLSQWEAEELLYEQVEYACIDAFVTFEIGMNLFSEMLNRLVYDPYVSAFDVKI
ncbi:3'-5' exonuclease-like [Nicotiana tabacum]|uniref:3'-5' exonuclease-like n=2 Tax=Nicotiana TaxID=4085 RepID=A0A1S4BD99_TOBAC|nr:PREDICTED: Werner Syndrome-like exonuclease [Nicotiana sylvestris]XP_016486905.1 PREDICTED: Werner Syndrome-like exonuclease [Nicotiana tabacum]